MTVKELAHILGKDANALHGVIRTLRLQVKKAYEGDATAPIVLTEEQVQAVKDYLRKRGEK